MSLSSPSEMNKQTRLCQGVFLCFCACLVLRFVIVFFLHGHEMQSMDEWMLLHTIHMQCVSILNFRQFNFQSKSLNFNYFVVARSKLNNVGFGYLRLERTK